MIGVITPSKGLNVRERADANSPKAGNALVYNTSHTLIEAVTGTDGKTWYKIAIGSKFGYIHGDYVSVKEEPAKENPPADPPSASPKPPTSAIPKSTATPIINDNNTPAKLKSEYWKYVRAMGCPPMYNKNVDLQYIDDTCPGCGRVFASTMLSNPAILSLCPGKVSYLPGMSGDEQKNFFESMSAVSGGAELAAVTPDVEKLDGKLYEFLADTSGYATVLNALCRSAAMFLDVGDETMINSSQKLKDFDYTYWTFPSMNKNDGKGKFFATIEKEMSAAISDSNYMHYFISTGEASVSEDISTGIERSMLEDALNTSQMDTYARNISYLFGGVANSDNVLKGGMAELEAIMGKQTGILAGIGRGLGHYLQGGRMVFPQMIGDISYGKSLSVTTKFMSPYGNKKSIFFYCLVPTMSILAMALPKEVADNMYTYPFIVRCYQQGWFNSDLAVISDVKIERGGADDTSWTIDGIATEWDVTFTIQPLYSSLMTTSTTSPFMFMKNGPLLEFLGNLCGVDLRANNLKRKVDMGIAMLVNKFTDMPTQIARNIGGGLSSKIAKLFQFFG